MARQGPGCRRGACRVERRSRPASASGAPWRLRPGALGTCTRGGACLRRFGWARCRLRSHEQRRRACEITVPCLHRAGEHISAGWARCPSLRAGPEGKPEGRGVLGARQDGPEDLDPETLEERVKEKARLKEEKAAIAAEKARLKAEKKKLRCARPRWRAGRAAIACWHAVVGLFRFFFLLHAKAGAVLQLLWEAAHVESGGVLVQWLPAEGAAVCARSRPEALSSAGAALPGRCWRIAACRSGSGLGGNAQGMRYIGPGARVAVQHRASSGACRTLPVPVISNCA